MSASSVQYLYSVEIAVQAGQTGEGLKAYLYTSTGTGTSSKPNTLVGQIGPTVTVPTASKTSVRFAPTSIFDFALAANTQYWIAVQDSTGGGGNAYVDWLTVIGTSSSFRADNEYYSYWTGSVWSTAIVNGHNTTGPTFAMRVESVPEPITTSLVGGGLVGMIAFVRRRRARQ